jgi:hypothetical protein
VAFTVFGVVNLLIGVFSAITVPVAVLGMFKAALSPEDPRISIDLEYQSLVIARGALRVLMPALLVGSGVLLLRGRALGRWLALGWVVLATVEMVATVRLDWATVMVPIIENTELRDPGAAPNLAESLGTVAGRAVFTLAYLAVALRYLFFDQLVRRFLARRRAGVAETTAGARQSPEDQGAQS